MKEGHAREAKEKHKSKKGKMLSRTSALGSTGWISIRKKKLQQDDA